MQVALALLILTTGLKPTGAATGILMLLTHSRNLSRRCDENGRRDGDCPLDLGAGLRAVNSRHTTVCRAYVEQLVWQHRPGNFF